ncbi:MAG: FHA domain-containing protein [Planctomycetes bacterium]|nr:FHA domain-containing protein [Planctomycetota bacterium]
MQIVLDVIKGPHSGRRFEFAGHDNFIVGRASFAHFRLAEKDPLISRVHFMIEVNPPQCRLLDMGSRNGTRVNEQGVRAADLRHGDLIRSGHTVLKVSFSEPEAVASLKEELPGREAVRAERGQHERVRSWSDDRRISDPRGAGSRWDGRGLSGKSHTGRGTCRGENDLAGDGRLRR